MKTIAPIVAILLLIGVVCFLNHRARGDASSAAYARGAEEARRELAAGTATLYVYGEPSNDWLDRETGLPEVAIAGCVVNSEILDRAAGHNDTIRASIREHGVPANSRKKWEKELFDLHAYWTATTKDTPPIDLSDGLAMTSDQRVVVSWIGIVEPWRLGAQGQAPSTQPAVVVGASDGERICRLPGAGRQPQLIWGPAGADVIIVRTVADQPEASGLKRFWLIDLRNARLLRSEFHQN